jgi:DNA polymerase (family 10)
MELQKACRFAEGVARDLRVTVPGLSFHPKVVIVGSVRRLKSIVRDIDLLIILPDRFMATPVQYHLHGTVYKITGKLLAGPRRVSIRVQSRGVTVKVDLFMATNQEQPFAMLHHTGSSKYNIRLRHHAISRGWKLNQYGLWQRARPTRRVVGSAAVRTERQLAALLGVSYRPPEAREN